MSSDDAIDSVKVRMYRHGFGDCFLLSFFHGERRVFAMLVDCGIKHNTRSDAVPIEAVFKDLKETLQRDSETRPRIDALVVTHEHWDHVAFFHPENSPVDFGDFDIGQVWLAWTEDPADGEAATINSRLRKGAAALGVAVSRLHDVADDEAADFRGFGFGPGVAAARTAFNAALNDVLGFYGVAVQKGKSTKTSECGIKYKPNGTISVETESAMARVVDLGRDGGVIYLKPGTKVDQRCVPPGINVYVLGPPRDRLINKMKPSSGGSKETYLGFDQSGLSGFIEGVLQMGAPGDTPAGGVDGPFGRDAGLDLETAKDDPYLKKTYFADGETYRQIEHCWLDVVGQFSLQLDGAINNTSLVLAIELEESGSVLLFPGDAQVGSWLSWHDHQWTVKRDRGSETITAADLLNRTVLYKVSHHGSHNATVKDKGLELMTHPHLVAMIPEREKSYNGILYGPLLDRLRELCKGRVLVSCDKDHRPETLQKKRPAELSDAEWKAFKHDLTVRDVYVEYTVR
jgi:hypothetical protein